MSTLSVSATAAANAAVIVNIPASAEQASAGRVLYQLQQLLWSYNGTPTNGGIDIEVDGQSGPSVHVTSGGPGFLPLSGLSGKSFRVTLRAGGASVTGKLTAIYS